MERGFFKSPHRHKLQPIEGRETTSFETQIGKFAPHCFEKEEIMTKSNASIAAVAAAVLLSGNAFAASLQPAAGEGPFFDEQPVAASTVERAQVRADAARHMPAAGEQSAQAEPSAPSTLTRAEVRAALLEAIAHGFYPAAG